MHESRVIRRSVVAMVLVAGSVAHGDRLRRADGDREDARKAFAAGLAADRQRDWHGAIEHYMRANDLMPHPNAMFNIATDFERIGKLREAAVWYQRYLDTAPMESPDRAKVARNLAALLNKQGTLTVRTNPPGARVIVDDRFAGTSPFAGPIGGGAHRVTVELDNKRATRDVKIEYGEPAMLDIPITGAPDAWTAGNANTTAAFTTTSAPAGEPSATEPPVVARKRLGYLVGAGGGADLRGEGGVGLIDLGYSVLQFDFGIRVGKSTGLTTIDVVARCALTNGRLAPYVGAGYTVLSDKDAMDTEQSGYGYTLIGGIKYDLSRSERVTTSIILESGLRKNGDLEPGLVIPLMASFQVSGFAQRR